MRVMFLCVLALAVGCGSGGTTMAAGQLAGTVYQVDGQSTNLAGIEVKLLETGQSAWTDASGAFAFPDLRAGRYTLGFHTSLLAAALQEGGAASGDGVNDGAEGDSGGGMGADANDDEFEDADGNPKVDVPADGSVDVDVALEGGKVKDFASDEGEGQHAMAKLHLTDAAEMAGYHVGGGIKIAASQDRTIFKVCVEGLTEGDVIDVLLGEAATSIGTATADGDGRACLVLENSIPLDAANLGELAGMLVQVYLSGSDLKLLVGEVPSLHEEHDGADEPTGDGEHHDGVDGGSDGGAGEGGDGNGTGVDGVGGDNIK